MLRLGSVLKSFTRLSLTAPSECGDAIARRSTGTFARLTGEDLWRSVTGVSNAGRKRGRASRNSRRNWLNLNAGQKLGEGKINMVWPGLTSAPIRGREVVEQQRLADDPEREERILALRDKKISRKTIKLHPLERGWSGTKPGGRFFGPPDPFSGYDFEGFESIVVESRMFGPMQTLGRQRLHRAGVVVGNRNGLVGYATAVASDGWSAIRKAKNKAGQKLAHFEICEDHTVFHDFYTEFSDAKLLVSRKPHGYGLVCHRVIAAVCKLIGIKDIHCKLDKRSAGPTNLIKAFLLGLTQQKSYQEMAEEKRLHLVEFRPEYGYFPNVVASPKDSPVRTDDEIELSEQLDFDTYIHGGRVKLLEEKKPKFYTKLIGWENHLKKTDNLKNERQTRLRLLNKYGKLESFLTRQDAVQRIGKFD